MLGNRSVQFFDAFDHGIGIHFACNHENRIIRRTPLPVRISEHRAGGLIERILGPQRVVRIGSAGYILVDLLGKISET